MRYALDMQWIRENPCRIKYASNYRPAEDPAVPTEAEVAVMLQLRAGFRPLSHARGRDLGATKIPKIWLLFIPEIRATTRIGFGRKWVSDLYFINKKLFVKLKGHVFALAHRRQS